jgi:hypothetical protein
MKRLAEFLTQVRCKWQIAALLIAVTWIGSNSSKLIGQTSSAVVSGHVIDQSGGAVANADFRLVEEQTKVALTARTNSSGDFQFTNTQPGTYTVLVAAPGYHELRKVGLVLNASQNLSAGTLVLNEVCQTVGQVSVTIKASESGDSILINQQSTRFQIPGGL